MDASAGFARASELLSIMQARLGMQRSGLTNPPEVVKRATEQLVRSLSAMDPTEAVRIEVNGSPGLLARYIRVSDGQVLAELRDTEA